MINIGMIIFVLCKRPKKSVGNFIGNLTLNFKVLLNKIGNKEGSIGIF